MCDTLSDPIGPVTRDQIALLCQSALKAREFAYAPYSKFRVGAALLTFENQIVTGCNIENAAFTPGTCAERTAFAKAISEGSRKFKAMAVATDVDGPCSPCGVCRQFAREFCELKMPIYLAQASFRTAQDLENKVTITNLGDLLPMSFGPEDLNKASGLS